MKKVIHWIYFKIELFRIFSWSQQILVLILFIYEKILIKIIQEKLMRNSLYFKKYFIVAIFRFFIFNIIDYDFHFSNFSFSIFYWNKNFEINIINLFIIAFFFYYGNYILKFKYVIILIRIKHFEWNICINFN